MADEPLTDGIVSILGAYEREHHGRYVVTGLTARGGFSEVYRAEDRFLRMSVAIKMSTSGFAPDKADATQANDTASIRVGSRGPHAGSLYDYPTQPWPPAMGYKEPRSEAVSRTVVSPESWPGSGAQPFRSEARMLLAASHPYLVEALHYFELESRAFLVLKYVNGFSLGHWLSLVESSDWNLPDVIRVMEVVEPLLSVLDFLHQEFVYHCDVKPENVLLDSDRKQPVLIDLGNACTPEHRPWAVTPGYSPPELYSFGPDASEVGPWTDLYMLSAMLYRMIARTFRPPISATERLSALSAGEPDPLVPVRDAARPGFPESVLTAVEVGLQLDPQRRPRSVEEYLDLLKRRPLSLEKYYFALRGPYWRPRASAHFKPESSG